MKKYIYSIALCLLAFAVSCQQQMNEVRQDIQILENSTLGKSVFYTADDEPLTFLPSRDSSAWTSIGSLQGRFDACTVPQQILDNMTTEAIVESVINYPLNYLVHVYNNPLSAIDIIFANSPLHQELKSRDDASEKLAALFSQSTYGFEVKTDITDDMKQLSYTDEIFLEYLIASEKFSKNLNADSGTLLKEAVSKKIQERLDSPTKYSIASIKPLMAIDEANGLLVMETACSEAGKIRIASTSTTTVQTPLGKTIIANINDELSASELISITNYMTSNYPNAIVRGSATNKYNSHSYVWHNQSVENDLWINAYQMDPLGLQLENYWTNDAYVSCTESEAVCTYNHGFNQDETISSIILPNGKYLTKWGKGPLMEHDKQDCPYMTYLMEYFTYRDSYITNLMTINGNTTVGINEYNTYYLSPSFPELEFEWEVRYMDAAEPKPYELVEDSNGANTQYKLLCQDYGLFKINVYGKYHGHTVLFA